MRVVHIGLVRYYIEGLTYQDNVWLNVNDKYVTVKKRIHYSNARMMAQYQKLYYEINLVANKGK